MGKRKKNKRKRSNRDKIKSCIGKRGFITPEEARKVLWYFHKDKSNRFNVYKCRYCKRYHIGHKPMKYWRE